MHIIRYLILISTGLMHFYSLNAQIPMPQFNNIKSENGLSHNAILCTYQDNEGMIWIGTLDGLNKYDGTKITTLIPPAIKSKGGNRTIWAILEDSHQQLWIGTEAGLYIYNRQYDHFTYIEIPYSNLGKAFKQNKIKSIIKRDSTLWLSSNNLLFELDSRKIQFTNHTARAFDSETPNINIIQSLKFGPDGNIWLGTNQFGLFKYNPESGTTTQYLHDPESDDSLTDNWVNYIFLDSQRRLWIATQKSICQYLPQTDTFEHHSAINQFLPNNNDTGINIIAEDNKAWLWLGTDSNGIILYNPETRQTAQFVTNPAAPRSICSNKIRHIFKDRTGVIWVGSWGGMSKMPINFSLFHNYNAFGNKNSRLANNNVWTIYEDRRKLIWIGTDNGLDRLNPKNNKVIHYHFKNKDISPSIYAIVEDNNNRIWIGTNSGLFTLSSFSEKLIHVPIIPINSNECWLFNKNRVRVIHKDSIGLLWLGTQNGLFSYNPETKDFISYAKYFPILGTNNHSISISVIIDHDSTHLWLGCGQGLFHFNKETLHYKWYKSNSNVPGSLSNSFIKTLHYNKSDVLWIGTRGGGLNRLDSKTDDIQTYNEKNGLSNDWVNGILEAEDGKLWISTNKGLSEFNPFTSKFTNYFYLDGIQDDEFNVGAYYRCASGLLCFGGVNGITTFYPSTLIQRDQMPQIVLTDLLINNKKVIIGDNNNPYIEMKKHVNYLETLKIHYQTSIFSFEFAALDYNIPKKNNYAYKMEGLDSEWHNIKTQRHATFTKLKPGNYTFHVKGSDCQHNWNETGRSIKIFIAPPFWQSLWFKFIVALSLISFFAFIYHFRIHQMRKRQEYLSYIVDKRTEQLQNELSERLRAEDKLNQYTANLESMVKKKTSELLDLKHKEFHMEKLAAIGQATSSIIHELRNPLSSIKLGITSLNKRLNLPKKNQECLDISITNILRMENMLKEMLDFSKPQEMHFSMLDINLLICDLVEQEINPRKPENIDIILSLTHIAPIHADFDKIRRALKNIIQNSISALPDGGTIKIQTRTRNNGSLIIQIKDTGVGIQEKYLKKVFEPYFSKSQSGTGLGLTIVEKIIKSHKGKVTIKSTTKHGTTVTISIPFNN
ncbi:GHKL domain-containing protein [bacterium]|nr:GHKL domain-containing protein [bacterium]